MPSSPGAIRLVWCCISTADAVDAVVIVNVVVNVDVDVDVVVDADVDTIVENVVIIQQ